MDHSDSESELPEESVVRVLKPQINNPVLECAILQLNFSPPVKITSHRFHEDVRNWIPQNDIFEAVHIPPEEGFDLDQIEITEVSTGIELQKMMEHLSLKSEWAVDVEHHDCHSYAGITCLIQISTTEKHFLIDPFGLNKEIKRDLKPLMESGNHVKVMHGAYNDLRWLQRDFDIFAWPVVDTQVICRKFDTLLKNFEVPNNISLEDLIDSYFSIDETQKNNFSRADFRIRPLPPHLKRYAIFDTIYLLPLILKLRQEIEFETDCSFITMAKDCAKYMANVALYKTKNYPSVHECMFQLKIGYQVASKFKSLFDWRNDKARVLDENPDAILGVWNIVDLIDAVTAPADISLIESFFSYSQKTKYISKIDFAKIKEIIDTEQYSCLTVEEALFPCMTCGEYSHPSPFWPRGEQNCRSRGKLYFDEKLSEKICANRADLDWKNTKSHAIGHLALTWKELNWIASEIRIYIKNLNILLKCQLCLRIVRGRGAVIFDCVCLEQPVACKDCWTLICPICQGETSQDGCPIELKHIEKIRSYCTLFLKSLKENYVENLHSAIMQFLFSLELELMCNYCFNPLSNTRLVPINKKITPFCEGCCQFVCSKPNQPFGVRVDEAIPSQLLDKISDTFTKVLSVLHFHCQQNEVGQSNSLESFPKLSSSDDNEDIRCSNYYYYKISNFIKIVCVSFAILIVSYIMYT